MLFYHVDRANTIPNTKILDFPPRKSTLQFGGIYDNLSQHGITYFCNQQNLDWSREIEIVLEFVRMTKYPLMPSRLQSVFASKTREEAQFWINTSPSKFVNLITLKTDNYIELDCSWFTPQPDTRISLETCCASFSLGAMCDMANAYWSGKKTSTPIMEALIPLPCEIIIAETIKTSK